MGICITKIVSDCASMDEMKAIIISFTEWRFRRMSENSNWNRQTGILCFNFYVYILEGDRNRIYILVNAGSRRSVCPGRVRQLQNERALPPSAAIKHCSMCVLDKLLQSCPTLCDPTDCRRPGSSVHRILQARTLECVTIPSSRGSSRPRNRTPVSSVSLYWQAGSLPRAWEPLFYVSCANLTFKTPDTHPFIWWSSPFLFS